MEIKVLCQILSNAFDMLGATVRASSKSQLEVDHSSGRRIEIHTYDQREEIPMSGIRKTERWRWKNRAGII